MGFVDILVFVVLAAIVIGIGLVQGSKDETPGKDDQASDYFLAGRGLTWWLVGFSLIAANISTEQFVGMSGKAADWLGMAIASYEWMAAITLIVVAFVFLPTFLKSGIYTIPEFLEYRYNAFARTVMAIATLVVLVGVPTASVIFSGAKVITGNFQGVMLFGLDFGSITLGCWIIGTVAAIYVFTGGLKACAWTDLLWGSGLILGGVIIAWKAFDLLAGTDATELAATAVGNVTPDQLENAGAWSRFWMLNEGPLPDGKLHMVRGAEDREIPWTALVVGLWIPNFFYWGLNQYITQRTLGSKSLAQGQKGVVFAAFLKLIIPFIVVIPGILAFNLFNSDLKDDAVNRNALVLSSNSPALYRSLTPSMKPEADDERNVSINESVLENLNGTGNGRMIYTFDAVFAELHPQDVARLNAHNFAQLADPAGLELPAAAASFADAAAFSQAVASQGLKHEPAIANEQLVAHDYDNAFPTLIRKLVPPGSGLKGFVLVAIFGAVVSSLASMLNSASTIATMDLYRKVSPRASQAQLVTAGRVFVVLFVLIAMVIAPILGHPAFGGIFTFIQEFQGFISPGILAIFLFGLLVHRAPRICGTVGLLLNPVLYGLFKFAPSIFGENIPPWLAGISALSFLDRMAVCFGLVVATLTAITLISPLKQPVDLPVNEDMDLRGSRGAFYAGLGVVAATIALYIVFW